MTQEQVLPQRNFTPSLALFSALLLTAQFSWAASGFIAVHAELVTPRIEAYGRVEPIAVSFVRAAQVGILTGIRVVPGSAVRAGQTLARLTGPEILSLLTRENWAVRRAQAELAAARKSLARQRALSALRLAVAQTVADAQSAVAAAEADLAAARMQLRAAQALMQLRAPFAGVVLAVNAADGEHVAVGQTTFAIQANKQLWLNAEYYGADAKQIQVGMLGRFVSAIGSPPTAVRVVSVFGTIGAGGGEAVGLRAVADAKWQSGDFGFVTLDEPPRSLVAVPTQALILDQGRWWVMVGTAHGSAPREVVPGPTRGWQTFIDSGLAPGAQVLVENAYLEFHRGIGKSYQPAD